MAGATASISFAIACYAELSSVFVAGATAAVGTSMFYVSMLVLGMSHITSAAIAATTIGFGGGLLARRFLIPPLLTAVAGITPMLPGLALYRGMYAALNNQLLVGFANMAVALSVAAALASGVVLGEWAARKLRRPPKITFYRAFRRPQFGSHSGPK